MNRYAAEPQPERGYYRVSSPWMVSVSSGGKPIIDLTEAEAKIIAFALNAVAEGGTLSRLTGAFNDLETVYDGPTEGVLWTQI